MPAPRVLIESRSRIGESPVWHPRENALYWVDVEGGTIHRWHADDGSVHTWDAGEPVGCIGLRRRGGLVGARRSGFFFLDTGSGRFRPIADPEADMPDNRLNDGKVDRRGRFWAGTRNFVDTAQASGALYRLDADLSVHRMETGLRCPNGMAWSPDDGRMYLCDTWARRICVYDFDPERGTISNRRLFRELPDEEGFPDGLTVDAEGCIWNAHYDGWRITRYAPDGTIEKVVRMPVRNVTSVTFGRKQAGSLFATTSWLRLAGHEQREQLSAGHVFEVDIGVTGIAEPAFAG
ncbi:MAG TPA: SMP-30/gluconolactonase/LRE family protein [Burkholderiales bacterium]|nr:SMP-30/gluconolactonase/LRE family protein [Burkholderiales bacterium]